jgi:acetyltransferase-like isoleucine patch superfamily enzyme
MVSKALIHPKALIDEGASIGARTRVWAFAHILSGAAIGEDCNICDHTFIEGAVRMGNRVTVKCGVHLWDGVIIEDDVFIGPSAVFTNDLRPRSKVYPPEFMKTVLKQGCSIGANATILPGLTIGRWAMAAAGAVVTRNVPDFGVVLGNPANFHSWICQCGQMLKFNSDINARCGCSRNYLQVSSQEIQQIP